MHLSKTLHAKVDRAVHERNLGALQGVFLGEINSELRQRLEIPSEVQGAVVFDLYAASAAAQAGLRPGDVIQSINRQEVRNAGEASRLTQNAKDKRTLLRVWSNCGSHFILIEDFRAMKPAANATRFFGSFDFPTPAEPGHSVCKTMSLSALRFCHHCGTACA